MGIGFADEGPAFPQAGEDLVDDGPADLLLLHGAERIGEIGLGQAHFLGRPLGQAPAADEDLPGFLKVVDPAQTDSLIVVVGVGEEVDGMILHDQRIGRRRSDDPGVGPVGVEEDGPVDIPVRGSRIQVIQADEGSDLRSVGDRPSLLHMEGPHVVEDDLQPLDHVPAHRLEGLDGLRLAGPGVAQQADPLLPAVLQDHVHESPVDGEPAPVHHSHVVDGQDHLFHVAEIVHLVAGGHAAYPQVLVLIVVEGALALPVRIAEEDDAVRSCGRFLRRRQLEKIGAGDSVGHEVPVEADEEQEPSHLGRITEKFLRISAEVKGRVLAGLLEHALPLGILGMEDGGRTQHDGIDEHDLLQELVALAQVHLIQVVSGDGRVGPGMLLPQDLVDPAAQGLLQLAESVADQVVELGVSFDQLRRLHVADPVGGHRVALVVPPEIVHGLHEAQGPVRPVDVGAFDLIHVEDDDGPGQPAQFMDRFHLVASRSGPVIEGRILFF